MSTTTIAQPKDGAANEKSATKKETPITEKLNEQVTKGLSQPPSRAQVPPGTAAEELVQ